VKRESGKRDFPEAAPDASFNDPWQTRIAVDGIFTSGVDRATKPGAAFPQEKPLFSTLARADEK
jgi:hypothetical protein